MKAVAEFQALLDIYVERYLAHDAAGCASCYVSDGVILSPFGPPAKGFEAIAAVHADWFREPGSNKVITVEDARIEGDVGYCLARFSADVPQDDGSFRREAGTSLNTFLRTTDGSWRIWHTSLNVLENET